MSDPNQPDPPLTPAQEAAVRRALAKAGGPEPMPGEIADRLDAVIADLAAERATEDAPPTPSGPPPSGPPPGAPPPADASRVVLPMDPAARRRRVRARIVLGAAAASVAIAVGAGLLSDRGGDVGADGQSHESSARAEDSAADGDSASREAPSATPTENSDGEPPTSKRQYGVQRVVTDEPLRTVRRDHLREDLTAVQRVALPHPATADYAGAVLTAPANFRCEPADYGAGYLVGVEYDGKPAVVAFREPMGASQEAEVLSCGTADLLHSTTLPAR